MKEFGKLALMTDSAIKKCIATHFIKDAAMRHCIAFFQWRKAFRKSIMTQDEVQEIIDNRYGYLEFKNIQLQEQLQEYKQNYSELYKKQQKFELDFKKIQDYGNYKPGFNRDLEKLFYVTNLSDIGWVDLIYPKEVTSIQKGLDKLNKKKKKDATPPSPKKTQISEGQTPPENPKTSSITPNSLEEKPDGSVLLPDDLIYPRQKYQANFSPQCITLPSPEIMLRIIRATFFVEDVEQLIWHLQIN